jgi:hypothetical protein
MPPHDRKLAFPPSPETFVILLTMLLSTGTIQSREEKYMG